MRTYVFKLYQAKRNKHLHHKINLAGSINRSRGLGGLEYESYARHVGVVKYLI
jgi:hypothetical protein